MPHNEEERLGLAQHDLLVELLLRSVGPLGHGNSPCLSKAQLGNEDFLTFPEWGHAFFRPQCTLFRIVTPPGLPCWAGTSVKIAKMPKSA